MAFKFDKDYKKKQIKQKEEARKEKVIESPISVCVIS